MRKFSGIVPAVGYGTWQRRGKEGQLAVETALSTGYRHIDTAQGYENEGLCGLAIANSALPRADIFIATKVRPQHLTRSMFLPTVEESLARLRSDYVDLLLIHWPSPKDEVPLSSYIEDLLRAKELGLARHIGLSNFTMRQIRAAEDITGAGQIATLQIELHPFHQNTAMVSFCNARNIQLTAFSPLALGRVTDDPVLQDIAEVRGCSAAQVALAFLLAKGFAIIPTSSNSKRMRENLEAQFIKLTPQDIAKIETLNSNMRLLSPDHAPAWDEY